MHNLGSTSVSALRQYVRAAQAQGIDTKPLLAQAKLPEHILDSDDGRVSGDSFQNFIKYLCHQANDPVFGLRTGDFVQPGSYSVLGYITMSCSTLGEAIARIGPFGKLVGDMGTTRISSEGDTIQLTWRCRYTDPDVLPQMVDNVFASWINFSRWLADNNNASPSAVTLMRPSPGRELESAYTDRWHCPVQFGADENAVIVPKSLLQAPLRQPDHQLRITLEAHAQSQLAELSNLDTLSAQVKHSIRQRLLEGITRQDMVADHLGMTSRTLQRRLHQEGNSYQRLLDEVRQEMAEDYLRNTALPIPDIAIRLGYSETTSFHRKFKAATGITPGEFRERDPGTG